MNTSTSSKINRLITELPSGVVYLSQWLAENGYSYDLQKTYRKSNWLTSIGTGAMVRSGDDVGYLGAIYALQQYAKASVHPGGKTALALSGRSHYLEMSSRKAIVFGAVKEGLPAWFRKHQWEVEIVYHTTSMLPPETGLIEYTAGNFDIRISGAVRAMMECLYLADDQTSLKECYELMEGLNNLVPQKVEALLKQCNSVKVKRLFLYFAERAEHTWFKYIKTHEINLGKGKRSLVKNGIYVPKYQITVPKI
ncbi:MAG: type IV toxin-antitoxin system AbiEi family antitoxin [Leadbetterella sp.]|nr:type IV toxin-antitoxin system AbiEi family antitoxin [Leadbetterella sp.]